MSLTHRSVSFLAFIVLSATFPITAAAQQTVQPSPDPHDTEICAPDGVAIGGYDVVAYHTENKAVVGDAALVSSHNNLTYRFSNSEHLRMFEANPESYLPHFQGWCAIALARNRLTCPDYKNFKIEDGKLLLFETIAFVNGRTVWDSDPIQNLISAEQNFRRFLEQ